MKQRISMLVIISLILSFISIPVLAEETQVIDENSATKFEHEAENAGIEFEIETEEDVDDEEYAITGNQSEEQNNDTLVPYEDTLLDNDQNSQSANPPVPLEENTGQYQDNELTETLELEEMAAGAISDYFPDPNFAAIVAYALDKNINDIVTLEELGSIRVVANSNFDHSKIHLDLTGVGYLTNVLQLRIRSETISIPSEIGLCRNLELLSLVASQSIDNIPAEMSYCAKLGSLELRVSDGELPAIPPALFQSESLFHIFLAGLGVEYLPDVSQMPLLQRFQLSLTDLMELPTGLDQCKNLQTLQLSRSNVKELPQGLHNTNLTYLYITYSPVTEIDPMLAACPLLKRIDFSGCKISEIPIEFNDTEIDVFQFKHNQIISTVPEYMLISEGGYYGGNAFNSQTATLPVQEHLLGENLSYAQILPPFLIQIKELNNNYLRGKYTIEKPDGTSTQVTSGYGSEIHTGLFDQLGEYVVTFASEPMQIGYHELSDLNYTMPITIIDGEAQNTFSDYFTDENLAQAVADLFDRNRNDSVTLDELGTVTRLHATNQNIARMDGIGYLSNLTDLNLSNNAISEVLPGIGELTSLTELRISHNDIEELPPEIGSLINLQVLGIAGNQLTSLPVEFENLINLTTLGIDVNPLGAVPDVVDQFNNLNALYANNIDLTEALPVSVFTLYNVVLSNQAATLPSIAVKANEITYVQLLPPVALQLKSYNNGQLIGDWKITKPSGVAGVISAGDGSEITPSLFDQSGIYTVEYSTGTANYYPGDISIGSLAYTIQVTIEPPEIDEPIPLGEYEGSGDGVLYTVFGQIASECTDVDAVITQRALNLSFVFNGTEQNIDATYMGVNPSTNIKYYVAQLDDSEWTIFITPSWELEGLLEYDNTTYFSKMEISIRLIAKA